MKKVESIANRILATSKVANLDTQEMEEKAADQLGLVSSALHDAQATVARLVDTELAEGKGEKWFDTEQTLDKIWGMLEALK